MAKGDRYASAAVGFVVGIGLVLTAIALDGSSSGGTGLAEYVETKDSAAQWLMMFFSFAGTIISGLAVLYVKDTFDQSVIANRQAREFFASENRPWLALGRPKVSINNDRGDIFFELPARNIGNTPAVSVELHASAKSGQLLFLQSVHRVSAFSENVRPSGWENAHKAVFPGRKRTLIPFDQLVISGESGLGISIVYCVTYRASRGETVFKTAGEVTFIRPDVSGDDWDEVKAFSFYGVSIAD